MRRSAEPLDLLPLPFEGKAYFVLVNPKFEAPTREMRAALPAQVAFKSMLSNSVAGGSLVRPLRCVFSRCSPCANAYAGLCSRTICETIRIKRCGKLLLIVQSIGSQLPQRARFRSSMHGTLPSELRSDKLPRFARR